MRNPIVRAGLLVLTWMTVPAAQERAAWVASVAPVPVIETAGLRPHIRERLQKARASVVANRVSAEAWRHLGELFFAHQFYGSSQVSLHESRRLAPKSFRSVYVLAIATDRTGCAPEKTVTLLRAALELDPAYLAAWRNLGVVYQRDGYFEEAHACFEQALVLDANFAAARLGLGQVLLSTGRVDAAVQHLNTIAATVPDDRAVNATLAQAYLRAGEEPRARELARRTVKQGSSLADRDPVLAEVALLGSSTFDARVRAEKALSEGRWADAVRDLELFLKGRSGSVDVRYHLARARTQLGDLKRARDDLRLVLAADPDNVEAMVLNARVLLFGGSKVGAARKYLKRVLADDPVHVEALVLSASAEVKREDYARALEFFDKATAQLASPQALIGAYRLTTQDRLYRGTALLGAGRGEEAVAQITQVIEIKPKLAEAHFRLGEAYEYLGRPHEASLSYEEARRCDEGLPVAQALRRLERRGK